MYSNLQRAYKVLNELAISRNDYSWLVVKAAFPSLSNEPKSDPSMPSMPGRLSCDWGVPTVFIDNPSESLSTLSLEGGFLAKAKELEYPTVLFSSSCIADADDPPGEPGTRACSIDRRSVRAIADISENHSFAAEDEDTHHMR
jgi:hypothetical protein